MVHYITLVYNQNVFIHGAFNNASDIMKKKVILILAVFALVPGTCFADEMSDAEAAIAEVESMLEDLNSMGAWFGPALVMKMEVEKYLEMAKESFDAGEYADALQHAEMALESAKKAVGLRAWSLLSGGRLVVGSIATRPD